MIAARSATVRQRRQGVKGGCVKSSTSELANLHILANHWNDTRSCHEILDKHHHKFCATIRLPQCFHYLQAAIQPTQRVFYALLTLILKAFDLGDDGGNLHRG